MTELIEKVISNEEGKLEEEQAKYMIKRLVKDLQLAISPEEVSEIVNYCSEESMFSYSEFCLLLNQILPQGTNQQLHCN